jgi:ribosomal protein L29
MSLPKFKDLNVLKTFEEMEQEIFLLQKNLFDLRMKRSTNQSIKYHLFTHYKRRIAQLNFKKSSVSKETK